MATNAPCRRAASDASKAPSMKWRLKHQVWDNVHGWVPKPAPATVAESERSISPRLATPESPRTTASRAQRAEFSERQKCEIFKRDRATCCYTTTNLWHLDDGIAGHSVQIDDVVPCAAGGTNDIENGVCAEFITNFHKRASSKTLLLRHGEPTEAFYRLHATVPAELANRLERLSRLHPADYFLNNALTKMQWLATKPFWERVDGAPFKRTPEYWCRAILNMLDKWRVTLPRFRVHQKFGNFLVNGG